MKKEKKVIFILLAIIVILSGYVVYGFVSNAMKLKSCYLEGGDPYNHLNGQVISNNYSETKVILDFYVAIANPNDRAFDPFLLGYYITCDGEFIHHNKSREITHGMYESTSLAPGVHNNYYHEEFTIYHSDISEKTWSKIVDGTGEWIIDGKLITYVMDDFNFRIEQTGFWELETGSV